MTAPDQRITLWGWPRGQMGAGVLPARTAEPLLLTHEVSQGEDAPHMLSK
jgi:hypothetical protein